MKRILTLFCLFLFVASQPARAQDPVFEPARLDSLYQSGVPFGTFLKAAERRVERWQANTAKEGLTEGQRQRIEALQGTWYLLAVAVDGCSDSVSTIPFLSHLAGASEHISMRIIAPDTGRFIMEGRPTPDGRAATPTVLVLNAEFEEVGAFIERPAALQEWALSEGADLSSNEFSRQKFAWYDEDAGRQTVEAVLSIMERAAQER
ncbi:MAG: thioredoxin family protein [Bacteroidetes bacterium]|nr:thioredoxin family protein [Bacteroidota bacterium]